MPNCVYENPKFYAVESSEGTKRLATLIFEKKKKKKKKKELGVIIDKLMSFIEYQQQSINCP